jgi:hypothetical protein
VGRNDNPEVLPSTVQTVSAAVKLRKFHLPG